MQIDLLPLCFIEESDNLHPFKEAILFPLNIKASNYTKNSCKRQEKQEGNSRPNKCKVVNKGSTGSLEAACNQPVFSQHLADMQEKYLVKVLILF